MLWKLNEISTKSKMNRGVVYEKDAYNKCVSFFENQSKIEILPQGHEGIDIPFKLSDQIIGFEVKMKHTDTMAGTSLRFEGGILNETPVKPVDAFHTVFPIIKDKIQDPLEKYITCANKLIANANSNGATYTPISGFPCIIPEVIRLQLKDDEKLQSKIQSKYLIPLESWKSFYLSKGSQYIHIGDRGLFHLGQNPLNLKVPELNGTISLEVRLLGAGRGENPYRRIELALKFKELNCDNSPYSLVNSDHLKELFQESAEPSSQ